MRVWKEGRINERKKGKLINKKMRGWDDEGMKGRMNKWEDKGMKG